jgi:hypothetical protein
MIPRIEPPCPAGKRRPIAEDMGLIRIPPSRYPKSLKESLELAGTQPQKLEMRPVWGAKLSGWPAFSSAGQRNTLPAGNTASVTELVKLY